MLPEELKDHPVAAALEARHGDAITGGHRRLGETTLEIDAKNILDVCHFLKKEHAFVRLAGITAVDWHPVEPRFEVVYLLHSLQHQQRLRLKCRLAGDAANIDSVCSVWRGADWYERETFDLFGIIFNSHPNLKRIMMPDSWEGHPLRRDFPIHGHKYTYAENE